MGDRMIAAMTIGTCEIERDRLTSKGVDTKKEIVHVTFPRKMSDDALRELGLFCVRLAEKEEENKERVW